MSKTIKNEWDKRFTFEKFLLAYERAKKGKSKSREVIKFDMDLETNLINLMNEIKNNTYHYGKYRSFIIYEPKKRLIKSLPFRDRVVHQWYVEEFIKPYMLPRFIFHTYACLPNKGGHKAVQNLQKMMRIMKRNCGSYYILKCDIKNYFYSIHRSILFQILKEKISDKKLLRFTRKLIFDSDEEKGIPIGNYTSQFFANIYLDKLDHYIKEELKVHFYIRYMDDFILLCETKEKAKNYFQLIEMFIQKKLDLKLNQKSKYYPNSLGADFCGYIIYETHIKVRKRSKKKMNRNILKWNTDYCNNKLNLTKMQSSWNSWLGHIKHANAYFLMKKFYNKINFLNGKNRK